VLLCGALVAAALGRAAGADVGVNGGPACAAGQLIVRFRPRTSAQAAAAVNAAYGAVVRSVNSRGGFTVLTLPPGARSPEALAALYRRRPEVEYAEPNYIQFAQLVPNDPGFPSQWALHNTGQSGGTTDADIDAPEAWDEQTGRSGVVIAVVDTGVDGAHADLAGNLWTNPGEVAANGLDDDGNGYVDDVWGWDFANDDNDPSDDHSHGTHVAGTMAARGNNGLGVVGVNWQAQIMPLKFLNASGSGLTTDAVEAIQYATANGARVINASWGGGGYSQALKDAIAAADAAGVLVVAAAGNNHTNNDIVPFYPASYDNGNIIAVSATDASDHLASFSNYGATSVDLGAPGVSILSTIMGNAYATMSGTSMAAPHVTGVAGLLMAEFPGLSHREVRQYVLASADPVAALAGLVATSGRLNAQAAIAAVPPALTVIFEDSMENGTNGWTVVGDTALWHQTNHRYDSPDTSWYYGIEGSFTYDTGQRNAGSLTSVPINLATSTGTVLSFAHFLAREASAGYDEAVVLVSDDGGTTFAELAVLADTAGHFVTEVIDLSPYDGSLVQVRFAFDTVDGLYNAHEGWYIDDVMVLGELSGPPPNLPPVANAGADQTVADADGSGAEVVALDGTGSADPDGSIVAYQWSEAGAVLSDLAAPSLSFAVGVHTVVLMVTDDGGATGVDEVTVTVTAPPPPGPSMHVLDVTVALSKKGSKYSGTASVKIVAGDGAVVPGAAVTGQWSVNGALLKEATGTTGKKGVATFSSGALTVQSGDAVTFTVMAVSKTGLTYTPGDNIETGDAVVVP